MLLHFNNNSSVLPHAQHCVKGVRIRSYSGPHFSGIFPHFPGEIRSISVFSPNAGKMQTIITPNTDSFYVCSTFSFLLVALGTPAAWRHLILPNSPQVTETEFVGSPEERKVDSDEQRKEWEGSAISVNFDFLFNSEFILSCILAGV